MAKPSTPDAWKRMLEGTMPGPLRTRRILAHVPSSPRCKVCAAPYSLPGSALMKLLRGGPSPLNRRICKWCIPKLHKQPGGAEVEISALFADVRGSTGIAEGASPEQFSKLLARFYGTAATAVDRHDGIVDKFVGDAAVALFIPGFSGPDHAAQAVASARELLLKTGNDGAEPWLPIGIGIDTGVSFVGCVGEGDALDFTALGDPVNTASRLSGLAAPGEILVSSAAASAAGIDTSGLERRALSLRGREAEVETWVVRA